MNASAPIVRPATPADAAVLAELGERTFRDTYTAYNSPENMELFVQTHFGPELQAAELEDPSIFVLIAELDGKAVGYAKLQAGPGGDGVTGARPVELCRLYAERGWHGRGIGSALMQACLDEAARRGHDTIWLGVWENNARARAFYGKWDFAGVGSQSFVLGRDVQRDYVLQRPVAPEIRGTA